LWEIAKKYGTSVAAIMEENDIEDDMVSGKGMILIPIV
ncbi:MAG: LysM peptidoglycan-binding domain-containing protein, partial [Oscillospiraceae bacterium]|nr:LysM peptidoglycan-binding domain-containing protein [Oscillospiraceae bacterium]